MKKVNDELTDLFRSRLGESEMQVRKGFWENLETDIPMVVSRRRQMIYRFTAAASVLLILVGASAALWYFSPKEEIANAFTQVAVSTGTSGSINGDMVQQEFPIVQPSVVSPAPSSLKPVAITEEPDEEESFSFSFSMSVSISSSSSNTGRYDRNSQVSYGAQDRLTDQPDNGGMQTASPASDKGTVESSSKDPRGKWSVGAYLSAGLLNYTSATVKHKLPLSGGISLRKELSDHWGIESGLNYTQLNSRLTTGDDVYNQKQTLHYIGIPVKVDYSLYKNNRMNVYASGGGMVEKCVNGSVDPLQLSLSAAVGVQYKVSNRLSLYAEPGLSYHFDDGSSITSIRKEKPLNMNLLCGVRMTY